MDSARAVGPQEGNGMRQEISNSELGTFRTCRRRWGLEYIDLLRPKLRAPLLTWGNTIHAGVEAGYLAAFASEVPPKAQYRLAAAVVAGAEGVHKYHTDYLAQLDEAVQQRLLGDEDAHERFEDAAKLLTVALWAAQLLVAGILDGRLHQAIACE